jgi:hypothetical protein
MDEAIKAVISPLELVRNSIPNSSNEETKTSALSPKGSGKQNQQAKRTNVFNFQDSDQEI